MTYDTWQEALAGLVKEEGLEETELGDISKRALASGSRSSNGIAGAPGPSTPALGTLGRLQIDVSSIPDGGSNTYQGQLRHISLLWRQDEAAEYMLTVCFDSKTAGRLKENLSGSLGDADMAAAASFPMTVIVEPSTT